MSVRLLAILLSLCLILAGGLGLSGCSRSSEADSSTGADSTDVAVKAGGDDADDSKDDSKKKSKDDSDDEEEKEDPPVPVDVAVLERGPIEAVLRASASLEAEKQVRVVAEAGDRVRSLQVEEGDRVKKGQTLLRLRDDEQRSAVAKAETDLAQAQREFERQKKLRDQDLTSDKSLNDAEALFDQARIALDDARRRLGYTKVVAPISGTVTQRMVNLGAPVTVGQELFEIIDFESLVARIYVPEKNLNQIRNKQVARVTAEALSDEPFLGSVIRISPVVDARTGTVKVTVAVGQQPGLRPGLFTDIELVTETHENAILVPKRSLVYDRDQTFVFRIGDERQVERVLVEPLLSDRFYIEPKAGLAEGDSIIIAGQTGLKEGVKVRLIGEPDPEDNDEDNDGNDATARNQES